MPQEPELFGTQYSELYACSCTQLLEFEYSNSKASMWLFQHAYDDEIMLHIFPKYLSVLREP